MTTAAARAETTAAAALRRPISRCIASCQMGTYCPAWPPPLGPLAHELGERDVETMDAATTAMETSDAATTEDAKTGCKDVVP